MRPAGAVLRGLVGGGRQAAAVAPNLSRTCTRHLPCGSAASVQRRGLAGGWESAPAIGALGLPEAVSYRAVDAGTAPSLGSAQIDEPLDMDRFRTVTELAAELIRRIAAAVEDAERTGVFPDISGARPLVDRALGMAPEVSLEELTTLAEAFERGRLRLPMRDLLPFVFAKLDAVAASEAAGAGGQSAQAVACCVRLLTSYGRGSLFAGELFEFLSSRLASMAATELSTYVYEAGRHGLRCRHYSDGAMLKAVELAPRMSPDELLRTWQGFVRFSRDRERFYVAALPKVKASLGQLTPQQLILVLRAARDLKRLGSFIDLHAQVCTELIVKMDELTVNEAAHAIAQCTHHAKYRAQAQGLVRAVEQRWRRTEDLSALRVVEVVDALETLASWGMKPLDLVDRLEGILIERKVELQYSGNVTLWVSAVQSLAKMEHANAKWPLVVLEMARDQHFVGRISFFQQCELANALGRLRLFDEAVYRNIAEAIVSDITLFREDAQDMALVLWSYASAGFFHEALFERCYDRLLGFMEEETLDLARRNTQQSVIQLAWAFALAGFHQRHASFAALLDYAFFTELDSKARPTMVRRLMQLSDAVALEAPVAAQNCQFPEKLEDARTNPRARQLLSLDPVGNAALMGDLRATLAELGNFDLVSSGLPGEAKPSQESGPLVLTQRLLHLRGWSITVLDSDRWSKLGTLDDRRRFLESIAAAC
mmetsp:Transcript_156101/g.500694  ORF Transcript_156101/g.500694 Transcript_156101/m.500694 type:complete len:712 (+) Transcript_156101:90-2225(+)